MSEFPDRSSIRLYQIFYRDDQQPCLDPDMLPWDNRNNPRPEWCEYWIMRSANQEPQRFFGELTGFFSWRCKDKLGFGAEQIRGFLQAHPGADGYLFSPAVFQVAFYRNVWEQGETWHPGLTALAQHLLDTLGYHVDLASSIDHHLTTAFCNYWVARRPFWEAYFAFMEPIFSYLESRRELPSDPFWQPRFGSTGSSEHIQALPVIPYLVERLFSVFVKLHPEFTIAAWEYAWPDLQRRTYHAAGLIPLANWCKRQLAATGDPFFLQCFQRLRQEMAQAMARTLQENPQATIG